MRVPNRSKRTRFYLFTGRDSALSSWATLDKARTCWRQLRLAAGMDRHHYEADFLSVKSIMEVGPNGRFAHDLPDQPTVYTD